MADLDSLLETSADSIEPPKALPAGTYVLQIGQHSFGESSQKKTPYVEYSAVPVDHDEDVDTEELEEFQNWREKNLRLRFYLSPAALFRVKQFLEIVGLDTSGKSLKELIPQAQGAQIKGYVSVQVMTDGSGGTYNPPVDQFMPLDD